MAGVEEKDIDRLLANPPEKVEIEVKYKIDVMVMEGVSQTILKKVILFLLLNKQRLNNRKLLLSRINYHRRSEFTEKISYRRKITIVLMNLLHLPTSAYSRPNIIVHIQVVHQ